MDMFKNYLKIAVRNIKRHKGYSFINVAGLAVGMACCILIFLYVNHEVSFDRFHKNASRIFRATKEYKFFGKLTHSAITPNPLGAALRESFPEVESAVRICSKEKKLVSREDKSFFEDDFFLVDPSFFDVFTFPLLKGHPEMILSDPWSVVISEKAAEKYFGNEDPIGQTLTYEKKYEFKITGVLENIPENSHFRSDFFASMGCADDLHWEGFLEDWTQSSVYTYILLRNGYHSEEFEKKLTALLENQLASRTSGAFSDEKIHLQPITRIHLHSNLSAELEENSDIRIIYFYSLIAAIILLIACVNFMNISTARASTRYKEVGMRKVIGAQRWQLIRQFLSESVMLSFLALPIAVIIVQLFLPYFRNLLGIDLTFHNLTHLSALSAIIGITLLVGIVSGSYPSFFLSAFNPVKVLRGIFIKDRKGLHLRNVLVTSQFIVSISLIICTLIINRQVNFIKNKNLGFNKDNVLAVHIPSEDKQMKRQYEAIKNELLINPDVLGVTSTSNLPHRNYAARNIPVGEHGEQQFISLNFMRVDYDFASTLEAKMIQGRFFSLERPADQNAFIINEAAVMELGFQDPIGKQIPWTGDRKPTVIGVVNNFHFKSLYSKIEPLVLYLQSGGSIDHILIKIRQGKIPQAISFIKGTLKKFNPARPLNYFFIDEDIDRMYRAENKFMQVFMYFTFLAIFIASLGLFGVATFGIQQKIKEIGIRKVLGASVFSIIKLLSINYLILMLVANIFAWPISFYFMNRWLKQFAYRIDMSLIIFIGSAAFALIIALLTLSYQSVKVAFANPVDSLRYE